MPSGWLGARPGGVDEIVALAFREDSGFGDLTAGLWGSAPSISGYIEAQGPLVVCGAGLAGEIFGVTPSVCDGDSLVAGSRVVSFAGEPGEILRRERVALNFLMQLSGVATLTRRYVDAVAGTRARIVDTRKTVPGLRLLQKYAVRCGGGLNHRLGLHDAAMLKDNHIRAAGSIRAAVGALRSLIPFTARIEVECESEAMVAEAVDAGADIVMLDNMAPAQMAPIVAQYSDRVLLEASGGITLDTVRAVAETGVHFISVGALTHSAPSVPLHLEFE